MLAWLAAMAVAVITCFFTTWRRPGRNSTRCLWIIALGVLPGSSFMVAHAAQLPAADDFSLFALFGVLFAPITFLESARVAPPLCVPAYVDVARLLFVATWTVTSFCAAMTALYF